MMYKNYLILNYFFKIFYVLDGLAKKILIY
jgi:hypothetical protein